MKKVLSLLIFNTLLTTTVFAQTFTWPMSGKKAGDNILFTPQSYIGNELNFANLFIGGKEGDVVVSPASGKIVFYSATYYQTLIYCKGESNKNEGDCLDNIIREAKKQPGFSQKFTSGSVTIQLQDGRKLSIHGIRGNKVFRTGQKISKGDTLGLLTYSYRGVDSPALMLSISKNGKAADPMSDFGLKTTFKPAEQIKRDNVLSVEKVREDIDVMEEVFTEAFPSLEDYISEDKFRQKIDSLKSSVTEPLDLSKSNLFHPLKEIIRIFHDSHIWSIPYLTDVIGKQLYTPALYFTYLEGKLKVAATTPEFKVYIDRAVSKIDGKPVSEYIDKLKPDFWHSDLDIKSQIEEALVFPSSKADRSKSNASEMIVEFIDGQKVTIPYVSPDKLTFNDKIARMYKWKNINRMRNDDDCFETRILNDSTAYLAIKTFSLNQVQTEDVINFLDSCKRQNLIVDLRNNGGGEDVVTKKIIAVFADKPFDRQKGGFSFVNKKGDFSSFKYSMNYSANDDIFPEYQEVENKNIYKAEGENTIMPDSLHHYSGKVYVLTNGRSYSAATLFPAFLVRNRRGVSVGRETGTGYHFMTALRFVQIQLPNSLNTINVPLVKCVFDTTVTQRTPKGRGLLPDYPIELTENETLMGSDGNTDVVLDSTLSLIAQGKYLSADDPFAEADSPKQRSKPVLFGIIGLVATGLAISGFAIFRKRKKN